MTDKINRFMDSARQGGRIALLALLLAGCHGTRKTVRTEVPEQTPPEPAAVKQQRTYTVLDFTGEAEGISVAGQLRVAQDSALWLSVNKIFEVARGLATTDSLFLRAPMLGYDIALDYPALRQRVGRDLTLADLQAIALSDSAEAQITQMAQRFGFDVKVRITRRRQVEHLTFPFNKNTTP